jgi:hypothetical protein
MRYKAIISYPEIIKREGLTLQRDMNFQIKRNYSIILMSVRKGSPYQDKWHKKTGILEYEGHDQARRGEIDLKKLDQPMENKNGSLTENGKFFNAAIAHKNNGKKPEIVQVYEKISPGIWCDRGRYELIDAKMVDENQRSVFKFFLKSTQKHSNVETVLSQTRAIPTSVKIKVWKRDQGHCAICKSTHNLHFDHVIPYSKGGSSVTAENIRILCAKHNLSKSDKIMSFGPWLATISTAIIDKAV